MKKTICAVLLLSFAGMGMGADVNEGEITIAREEWLPEEWSAPDVNVTEGMVTVTPSIPTLKKQATGIRLQAKALNVKEGPLLLQMVGTDAYILDKNGVSRRIEHMGRYKINRSPCVAVGSMNGKIYFMSLPSKRFFTAPDASSAPTVNPAKKKNSLINNVTRKQP